MRVVADVDGGARHCRHYGKSYGTCISKPNEQGSARLAIDDHVVQPSTEHILEACRKLDKGDDS